MYSFAPGNSLGQPSHSVLINLSTQIINVNKNKNQCSPGINKNSFIGTFRPKNELNIQERSKIFFFWKIFVWRCWTPKKLIFNINFAIPNYKFCSEIYYSIRFRCQNGSNVKFDFDESEWSTKIFRKYFKIFLRWKKIPSRYSDFPPDAI